MSRADKLHRRRIRKEREARQRRGRDFPWAESAGYTNFQYTITREALDNTSPDDPPGIDGPEFAAIYRQVRNDPKQAIPKIESLLETFPRSRKLINWLACAHGLCGDVDRAEKLSERNLQFHPDYLFAKAALAIHALGRGDLRRVDQLFQGRFDLKLLYPHRDVFHISELIALSRVAVEYYLKKDNEPAATETFDLLLQMATEDELMDFMFGLAHTALEEIARRDIATARLRKAGLAARFGRSAGIRV